MPGRALPSRTSSQTPAARRGPKPVTSPISPLPIPPQILRTLRTVVVYGGSFDPPHFFHTVGPLSAVTRLYGQTGWLLYIPAAASPHKPSGPQASDAHRLAMLKLAMDLPGPRSIWTDELDRAESARDQGITPPPPSFTIDTLRRLRQALPKRITLRLLIGSDQVAKFHTWKEPREIIRLAEPLIMPREPVALVSSVYSALDGNFWSREEKATWCQRIAPIFPMEAASTDVRRLIPGAPIKAALWERRKGLEAIITPVAQYIIDHNLYSFRPGKPKPATNVATMPGDAPGAIVRLIAGATRVLAQELGKNRKQSRGAGERKASTASRRAGRTRKKS